MDRATRNFDHLNRKKKEKKIGPKFFFLYFFFSSFNLQFGVDVYLSYERCQEEWSAFSTFFFVGQTKKNYFFTHWPDIFACQVNFIFLQIGNPSEY
jgi:hypothetical protein